jgi:hypothetical protein
LNLKHERGRALLFRMVEVTHRHVRLELQPTRGPIGGPAAPPLGLWGQDGPFGRLGQR